MSTPRYFPPELIQKLDGLPELALDCNYSWSHRADEIWLELDSNLYQQTRNPGWYYRQLPLHLEELATMKLFVENCRALFQLNGNRSLNNAGFRRNLSRPLSCNKLPISAWSSGSVKPCLFIPVAWVCLQVIT